MEQQIADLLKEKIKENYDIALDNIRLEVPPKKELWDFAFGCFVLSRDLKKNPTQIAMELKKILNSYCHPELVPQGHNNLGSIKNRDSESSLEWHTCLIEEVTTAWPYINIRVSKTIFTDIFNSIYSDIYGFLTQKNNSKTIVIDYIWANVWKPLHIGHMCTPNQGQVLVNLYRKLGYTVIADSHIGDWGIIFGKLILAYKLWWDENKLKENAIDHLLELYIKITEEAEKKWDEIEQKTRDEFKLLSEWNIESVELWREFTKYSIEATQTQLDRLNIKADYNIGESFYEGLWFPKMEDYPDLKENMQVIVAELIKKEIATKNDDNSVWVIFPDEEKIPSCILQKRDWTHGYLASDLASIKYRMDNWNPEKIVYFVDVRQQLHLKQAFTIAKKAWWLLSPHPNPLPKGEGIATELFHASNWFISLKDWAMSTRKGRIIKLDKLLDEAEQRARKIILEKRDDIDWEELDKISKIIWIGAIKYGYLKKSRETDVVFDWDEFMSFEGNSWPYIQYAYVRAIRIMEKANLTVIPAKAGISKNTNTFDRFLPSQEWQNDKNIWKFELAEEAELVKAISSYKEAKEKTAKNNTPHVLCKYAYDLTKTFNSFYNNVHILNETDEDKKLIRLKLINLFSITLKDCFAVLGIDMPEKM